MLHVKAQRAAARRRYGIDDSQNERAIMPTPIISRVAEERHRCSDGANDKAATDGD